MSMISSLDALEAATDATSVPRAAVFQPKVKARVRKGGGGVGLNSTSAKLPAPPAPVHAPAAPAPASQIKTITAAADPTPVTAPPEIVATATEISTKVPALENASSVIVESGTVEEPIEREDIPTPTTDDVDVALTLKGSPEVLVVASEGLVEEPESVATDEILEVQDEVAPVAVRSNFPAPSPATGGVSSDQDVDLGGRALSEQDSPPRPTSKPSTSEHIEESELYNSGNLKSGLSPKPSRRGRAAAVKRPPAVEDSQPLSGDALEESGQGEEEDQAVGVEEEAEILPEMVPTNKGGRKRKFPHSTSQPRVNRVEKDGVALKVDFSKADLSNPGKLTMREIIRRAEAIERKKLKAAEGNKKSAQSEGNQNQIASVEASERDAVSIAPQVQVVNGRIVINEQSLTVGAYATSRLNTDTYTRVEENAPRLNYNSYREKAPKERWKADDTDVFYMALKQFGTDFELIQNLFPGRTRRQVKAKFKKEERNNPRRLQEALAFRPQGQAHYTDMINRLKCEEPDPVAGDPFADILAYSKNAATQEIPEEVT